MAPRAHCPSLPVPRPRSFLATALFTLALLLPGASAHSAPRRAPVAPVRMELYAMSQCPFTAKVVQTLQQVVADFGPSLELKVDYIGQQTEDGELQSLHGPSEVVGDLAQICAARHAPEAYFRMMGCQSQNVREVDKSWERCARDAGVPLEPLRRCIQGAEGRRLLAASFARSSARGAKGSPTLYIGGSQHQGKRTVRAFALAICSAATEPKPAACHNVTAAPPVHVTVLNDRRCPDCNTRWAESRVQRSIENPVLTTLDYSEPAGRRLYAAIRPAELPAIVLDASLDTDPDAAAELAPGARQVGPYRVVSVGRTWKPECADPGGCGLAVCRDTLACRAATAGSIELFMMSQCPYASKALLALPDALQRLGPRARLTVHYIGTGDVKGGLRSMHGDAEVEEDIRQICAIKAFPKTFLSYLTCRAKDPRSTDWEACTGSSTGIAAAPITACVRSGEGARLLERSFRVSESLGISASPSWIAGGRHKFSAIDADAIHGGFCAAHPTTAACSGARR